MKMQWSDESKSRSESLILMQPGHVSSVESNKRPAFVNNSRGHLHRSIMKQFKISLNRTFIPCSLCLHWTSSHWTPLRMTWPPAVFFCPVTSLHLAQRETTVPWINSRREMLHRRITNKASSHPWAPVCVNGTDAVKIRAEAAALTWL